MNDRNPELEERLRTALRARSEEIEPGNDSYVRLQQRVAAANQQTRVGESRFPPRYFVAAAVLLVAVASAAALVGQQRRSSVEAVGPTSSAPTTVVEQTTITTTPEAPAEINVVTTTVPPREYVPAPVAGPREETREAAALAFLELLEVDHAGIESMDCKLAFARSPRIEKSARSW